MYVNGERLSGDRNELVLRRRNAGLDVPPNSTVEISQLCCARLWFCAPKLDCYSFSYFSLPKK